MCSSKPNTAKHETESVCSRAPIDTDTHASAPWSQKDTSLWPHNATVSGDRFSNFSVSIRAHQLISSLWYTTKRCSTKPIALFENFWHKYGHSTFLQNASKLVRLLLLLPLITLVKIYCRYLSPLLPPRCRFYPSCSSYTLSVLHSHGLYGVCLAARRLACCHPWHPGGVDMPPKK